MKISADFHKTPAAVKPAAVGKAGGQTALYTKNSRLNAERSAGEALSIAHMSQNLIQRALAVARRLQGIASEALSTGKINIQGVNEALSDIRFVLGNFGESVTAPVQSPGRPMAKIPGVPEITDEKRAMKDIPELVSSVRAAMEKDPDYALLAQGNISRQSAGRFLT
ncbi:MAG: hypothetical protein A2W19_12990 [Spirochaetes bacterium RBG_16_49_21]|nr:MAG: hypothetical protein A2W19_12990 [Spirochaetes bacterium RBG_16_49_21]